MTAEKTSTIIARLQVANAKIFKDYEKVRKVLLFIADRAEKGILAKFLIPGISKCAPWIREIVEGLDELHELHNEIEGN